MKKIKVVVNGGLVVHSDDAKYMPLSYYVYKTKSGDEVSSIQSYTENGEKYVKFPRNIDKFEEFCVDPNQVEYEYATSTNPIKKFKMADSFDLREYQKPVVESLIKQLKENKNNSTMLQAAPSFGKSFILPKIVRELGQKTLVLVDRNLLRDQMVDEFTENSEAVVVKMGKETTELGDVTISTFQMLLKNKHLIAKFKDDFGFIVVDEAHVTPAAEFLKVLSTFTAKYRLGLSATPTRSDGLTSIITDTFGYKKVVGDNPNNLKVFNLVVKTNIPVFFSGKHNYAKNFVKAMNTPFNGSSDTPISLAVYAAKQLHKRGRRVLLYATYGSIQKSLKMLLKEEGLIAEIISGSTKKSDRTKYIKEFQEGKIDILISGVILQKGVSIHNLDTIINLATQNKENVEQVKGRLRREYDGKKSPLFIYFTFSGKLQNNSSLTVNKLADSVKVGDKYSNISIKTFKERLK